MNRPLLLIDPPPLTVQVKVGWLDRVVPNWSRAEAENCWVAEVVTVALAGETAMLVSV